MKLIMAISKDGFIARSEDDDMSWTPAEDKKIFKLLTLVGKHPLCAGRKTVDLMPDLFKRPVTALSQSPLFGKDLETFAHFHPDAWLIGGQSVALEAIRLGLIHEVVLCMSTEVNLVQGIRCDPTIFNFGNLVCNPIDFGSVSVQIMRK